MSQRLVSDASFNAFSSPCLAVTLPGTTVNARTSNSGEFKASRIASASSVPGSVSMITFLGAMRDDWNSAVAAEAFLALARASGATQSGEPVANKIKTGTNLRMKVLSGEPRKFVRSALLGKVPGRSAETGIASAAAPCANAWENLCGTSRKGPPPRSNDVKAITDFAGSQYETGTYEKISTATAIRFANQLDFHSHRSPMCGSDQLFGSGTERERASRAHPIARRFVILLEFVPQ